jgi:hypothetical protein
MAISADFAGHERGLCWPKLRTFSWPWTRGTPFIVAAWMVGAMATFAFYLHTTATHEIRFTGPDTAVGSIHVFNATG